MHLQARMTLYALLTELETDLRTIISDQLGLGLAAEKILHPELLEKCRARSARDHGAGTSALLSLLSYADLGDELQVLETHRARLTAETVNMLADTRGEHPKLILIRNRVMHSRPINFGDLPSVLALSDLLVTRFAHLFPQLVAATVRLEADPSFVLGQKIPRSDSDNACYHNLPFPEFDETGFIGREQDLATLHKRLRGPYPVVSILGEGGLGKTALALRAAYDLLDDPRRPFDAIIWTTSKSTVLTAHEVREIAQAITTSTAMLQNAADQMATIDSDDPLENIYAFMREYRLLLILDNLETVLDDRIKTFLEEIPNHQTKVVLTSRVSMGRDMPVTLKPMEESTDLLRAVAKVRDVESLIRTNNKQLVIYCKRLHHNPLAIKWFVSAVQHGSRPEDVLREQGLMLSYCMDNVYKHLSSESRAVLAVFQTVGAPLDIAKLVALTGLDAARVKAALLELDGTNMVAMRPVPTGASYETTYAVSGLAMAFLNRHQTVKASDRDQIERRRRRFVAMVEEVSSASDHDPFSIRTIIAKNEAEVMVSGILLSALDAVRREKDEDFLLADEYLDQAKSIAPDYFEVHRVEGYIRSRARRIGEAISAYEAAIELAPNHAPLRYWFAQLLVREQNLADAKTHLDAAAKLMQDEPRIKLEQARLQLYQRRFQDSRATIETIVRTPGLGDTYIRMAHDLSLQSHFREADDEMMNRRAEKSLVCCETARRVYDDIPLQYRDTRTMQTVVRGLRTTSRCERELRETSLGERAFAVLSWSQSVKVESAESEARVLERRGAELVGTSFEGVVSSLISNKFYGFIKVLGTHRLNEVFFHRSRMVNSRLWSNLRIGIRVKLTISTDETKRLFATEVDIVHRVEAK